MPLGSLFSFSFLPFFIIYLLVFEIGFFFVILAVLELSVDQSDLKLRDLPTYLSLKGMCHHCLATVIFLE